MNKFTRWYPEEIVHENGKTEYRIIAFKTFETISDTIVKKVILVDLFIVKII